MSRSTELEAHADGLICLTGGAEGPLGRFLQAGQGAKAEAMLTAPCRDLPRPALCRAPAPPGRGRPPYRGRAATEPGLVAIAYELDLPLVATNDVHFPKPDMYDAHDALICIADGAYVDQQEPRRRLTPEHCFKTADEMVALFADLPEALENTVEIARRCAFGAQKRKPILPRFAEDEVRGTAPPGAPRGWPRGSRSSRMPRRSRTTRSGWSSSSASSRRWAFPAIS